MKGTFKIAKIAEIPIRIHWSFSLLAIYFIGMVLYKTPSIQSVFLYVAFVIAVFMCVILHELGHAMAAKYYGVRTHEIVLLPIGGVAILEYRSKTFRQEFFIALAGPLTNALIAFVLWLLLLIFMPYNIDYIGLQDQLLNIGLSFFQRLMWLNVIIAGFNLIPTLPLDGGVMLRAVLMHFFSQYVSFRIQNIISMIIAITFVVYSYYTQQIEYLIFAWFIYFYMRNAYAKK